jgi:DNA-binding transcriptional ArsR family regulator
MTDAKRLDDSAISALSHPVRRALLDELLASDRPRVKDLAAAIDKPANQVSFHLRVLEDAGIAIREPTTSDRRESRWRATDRHWSIDRTNASAAGTIGFLETEHARERNKLRAVFDAAARHVAGFSDAFDAEMITENFALSDEQAAALFRELTGVISRHGKAAAAAPGSTDSRRWYVTSYVVAAESSGLSKPV